ncbi:MAG TPA: SemiSWEET family transporter, partial [Cyclobacteriaceae bacterium]|nr:SemiSWEET family transporter [Cyclobacteriaceae bacterium]
MNFTLVGAPVNWPLAVKGLRVKNDTFTRVNLIFMDSWVETVGYFGSFLSTITFFPQVYKAWKTKRVGDLSMTMILIVFTSTLVWIVYGVAKNIGPVILCNSIMSV